MSSTDSLAAKIAEMIEAERPAVELSAVRASLEAINLRLDKLESANRPEVVTISAVHPSLDKLSIAEAIADKIFGGSGKEKACSFEPNGKPCDHCSMCNSRGF